VVYTTYPCKVGVSEKYALVLLSANWSKLMLRLIFLVFLLVSTPLAADTRSEITAAIDYYAQVWNENDARAIESYYHSDFLLVSDSGILTREQQVKDIEHAIGKGGDRGVLDYSDVAVKELGENHAMAYGHLTLEFKDKSSLDSWFSTVYLKTPFGWKALLTRN
jgi:ketosteroid isomerase-like protein